MAYISSLEDLEHVSALEISNPIHKKILQFCQWCHCSAKGPGLQWLHDGHIAKLSYKGQADHYNNFIVS